MCFSKQGFCGLSFTPAARGRLMGPHLGSRWAQRSRRQPSRRRDLACSTTGHALQQCAISRSPMGTIAALKPDAAAQEHPAAHAPHSTPGCGCMTRPPVRHAPHSCRHGIAAPPGAKHTPGGGQGTHVIYSPASQFLVFMPHLAARRRRRWRAPWQRCAATGPPGWGLPRRGAPCGSRAAPPPGR